MRTAVFRVPGIPPSPNRTLGRRWQATLPETEEWRARGALAVIEARRTGAWDGRPFARARVTFRFVYPDRRRRDPDNALASCKRIWDMFRPSAEEKQGVPRGYVLWDDDWEHIERVTVEYGGIDRRNPRVEVLVEEAGAKSSFAADGAETGQAEVGP